MRNGGRHASSVTVLTLVTATALFHPHPVGASLCGTGTGSARPAVGPGGRSDPGRTWARSPRVSSEALMADSARAWVGRAIVAMGGEAALRALRGVRLTGFEEENAVGIASDPAHALVILRRFVELRDVRGARARRHDERWLVMQPEPLTATTVLTPATAGAEATEYLERAPERIVLEAYDARDLEAAADTSIGGVRHHVVDFGAPTVHLYLDARTGLPRGWSTVRTYPTDIFVWGPWGDVRSLTTYDAWSLESNGIRYPRMITLYRNNILYRRTSILAADWAAATPPDSFATSSPRSAGPVVLGNGRGQPPVELAPGIVLIPGQFNVTLVRQGDGVVVIEAPHSTAYARAVMAEVAQRFPGVSIKAVVSTTVAWPHNAGIREYVARGIPVYAPAANGDLFRRLITAPHRQHPDSLARVPRPLRLRAVVDTASLGTGPNRMELLIPRVTGGAAGGNAMLVYFPERHLLYASDFFIPERFEPNFWRQGLSELVGATTRAGLRVDSVFGLHQPGTPWTTVTGRLNGGGQASGDRESIGPAAVAGSNHRPPGVRGWRR